MQPPEPGHAAEHLTDVRVGDARAPSTAAGAAEAAFSEDAACPFLIAAAGAWRMSVPDRDHRCTAFAPATSLAPGKQARLCLTAAHAGCATYLASLGARQARLGSAVKAERVGRWGISRSTPVVREIGGLRASLMALASDRRTWPVIPAILLGTLAVALGLSGSWGEAPVTAVASPTATAALLPTLRATALPSPVPSETAATPLPSLTAPPPSATPRPPVAYTTYRVSSGDTLSGIANRFHTTVKAITQLNGISASTVLHAGDILKIPTS
ncbi:MAG: LysM peptidoglycan-binding domain-containing protein [Verrucomicrobiota bacterium]